MSRNVAIPWRNRLALAGVALFFTTIVWMLFDLFRGNLNLYTLIVATTAMFLYAMLVTDEPVMAHGWRHYGSFAGCIIVCVATFACAAAFDLPWYCMLAVGMGCILPIAWPAH